MVIMLLRLLAGLTPVVLAGLLGWTGGTKLLGRRTAPQAANSALGRLLPGPRAAGLALRAAGAVELGAAVALLLAPLSPVTAAGAVALGACFAGYLGYAKVAAPGSSCGCAAAHQAPVTWRSFARAGLVMAGGAACTAAQQPWWSAAARRPVAAALAVAAMAVTFALLSSELDDHWLVPLRRARAHWLGHPLAGTAGPVPLAATVELLEASLAWQTMAPVIRSALAGHWDSDGWRILRYTGVYDGPAGLRPVSVVFAIDATATMETVREPVIRVSVVDEERQEAITIPPPGAPRRPLLPLAEPAST